MNHECAILWFGLSSPSPLLAIVTAAAGGAKQ